MRGNSGLSVMRYENDTWSYIGASGFATTSSTYFKYIDLEIGTNDVLYVSYINSSNKASVKKFDGTDWVSVGTDGFSDGQVEYLTMTLSDAKPTVAYMDKSAFSRATVKQFDGANWVTLGSNGLHFSLCQIFGYRSQCQRALCIDEGWVRPAGWRFLVQI